MEQKACSKKQQWRIPQTWEKRWKFTKKPARTHNQVNVKRPTARNIVIKLEKVNDKEIILRAAKQKKTTYKGTPVRLSAGFSAQTLQARSQWKDIFKILKDRIFLPRILYAIKLSFRYDREINAFPDQQKPREIIALQDLPYKKGGKDPSYLK